MDIISFKNSLDRLMWAYGYLQIIMFDKIAQREIKNHHVATSVTGVFSFGAERFCVGVRRLVSNSFIQVCPNKTFFPSSAMVGYLEGLAASAVIPLGLGTATLHHPLQYLQNTPFFP